MALKKVQGNLNSMSEEWNSNILHWNLLLGKYLEMHSLFAENSLFLQLHNIHCYSLKHNTLHTLFELPPILSQFKQLSLYCCVCVHSILDFTALENVKVVRFNVFSSQRLEQHVNRKASLSLTNNGLHTKPHKTHSYILLAHFSLQWINCQNLRIHREIPSHEGHNHFKSGQLWLLHGCEIWTFIFQYDKEPKLLLVQKIVNHL